MDKISKTVIGMKSAKIQQTFLKSTGSLLSLQFLFYLPTCLYTTGNHPKNINSLKSASPE